MDTIIRDLVIGVVIAVVSASVTVYFAIRKFRTEKWWERKVDIYISIIEALHHVKRGTQDSLNACQEPRKVNEEHQKQLTEKYYASWDEIHKAVDTGSFFLCRQARTVLDALIVELRKADDDAGLHRTDFNVYDAYSTRLEAINRCLEALPPIAKKDLSVKS